MSASAIWHQLTIPAHLWLADSTKTMELKIMHTPYDEERNTNPSATTLNLS